MNKKVLIFKDVITAMGAVNSLVNQPVNVRTKSKLVNDRWDCQCDKMKKFTVYLGQLVSMEDIDLDKWKCRCDMNECTDVECKDPKFNCICYWDRYRTGTKSKGYVYLEPPPREVLRKQAQMKKKFSYSVGWDGKVTYLGEEEEMKPTFSKNSTGKKK